jgi:hypothetical protein
VFTAQYALSPYIKQISFVFKGLMNKFKHFSIQPSLLTCHKQANECVRPDYWKSIIWFKRHAWTNTGMDRQIWKHLSNHQLIFLYNITRLNYQPREHEGGYKLTVSSMSRDRFRISSWAISSRCDVSRWVCRRAASSRCTTNVVSSSSALDTCPLTSRSANSLDSASSSSTRCRSSRFSVRSRCTKVMTVITAAPWNTSVN